jgi:hypothetical protein
VGLAWNGWCEVGPRRWDLGILPREQGGSECEWYAWEQRAVTVSGNHVLVDPEVNIFQNLVVSYVWLYRTFFKMQNACPNVVNVY